MSGLYHFLWHSRPRLLLLTVYEILITNPQIRHLDIETEDSVRHLLRDDVSFHWVEDTLDEVQVEQALHPDIDSDTEQAAHIDHDPGLEQVLDNGGGPSNQHFWGVVPALGVFHDRDTHLL